MDTDTPFMSADTASMAADDATLKRVRLSWVQTGARPLQHRPALAMTGVSRSTADSVTLGLSQQRRQERRYI